MLLRHLHSGKSWVPQRHHLSGVSYHCVTILLQHRHICMLSMTMNILWYAHHTYWDTSTNCLIMLQFWKFTNSFKNFHSSATKKSSHPESSSNNFTVIWKRKLNYTSTQHCKDSRNGCSCTQIFGNPPIKCSAMNTCALNIFKYFWNFRKPKCIYFTDIPHGLHFSVA